MMNVLVGIAGFDASLKLSDKYKIMYSVLGGELNDESWRENGLL